MKTVNFDKSGRTIKAPYTSIKTAPTIKMWQAELFILASALTALCMILGHM